MLYDCIRIPCGRAYEHVVRFAASGDGPFHTLVKVLLFLTVYPLIYVCIRLDRTWYVQQAVGPKGRIVPNPLIPFPRRPREIRENPKWLFDRLVALSPEVFRPAVAAAGIAGPTKIVFSDAATFAPLDTEPGKNEAVIRVVFKFCVLPAKTKGPSAVVGSRAAEHSLDVFVKTPSVREFSLSLKALASTFGIQPKEVIWYEQLMKAGDGSLPFPLPVPGAVLAEYARLFDTYIVVTHTAGAANGTPAVFKAIPDWRMHDLRKARHMLAAVAAFHAANWDLRRPSPARCFDFDKYFPGEMRTSTAWVSGGMSLFFSKRATPALKEVWPAITRRLQTEPLVMSHGDYRPGNMLWNTASAEDGPLDLVVCDMELANVTPYGWDASYMLYIGLPVDLRREHETALFGEYLTALTAALRQARRATGGAKTAETSAESGTYPVAAGSAAAATLHQLFGLTLFFYGWTLAVLGEMPDSDDKNGPSIQGNTFEDGKAWHDRMVAMHGDLVGPSAAPGQRAALAAELGLPEGVMQTFYSDGMVLLRAREPEQ